MSVDVEIMDLSETGAKLRFGRDVGARPGHSFWLEFPEVDIDGKSVKLLVRATCRWYNTDQGTLGSSLEVTEPQRDALAGLMDQLAKAGRLAC